MASPGAGPDRAELSELQDFALRFCGFLAIEDAGLYVFCTESNGTGAHPSTFSLGVKLCATAAVDRSWGACVGWAPDGSELYIDGHAVVLNGGQHYTQLQRGSVELSKGKHRCVCSAMAVFVCALAPSTERLISTGLSLVLTYFHKNGKTLEIVRQGALELLLPPRRVTVLLRR